MRKSQQERDRRRAIKRARRAAATPPGDLPRVTVRYSCLECGLSAAEVEVPAHTRREDPRVWVVTKLAYALRDDHARRSPICRCREMTEVLVPITSTGPWEEIGAAILSLEEGIGVGALKLKV